MYGRRGKAWETAVRKEILLDFRFFQESSNLTEMGGSFAQLVEHPTVLKAINFEEIDFFVIAKREVNKTICALVEAKSTKKKVFYPFHGKNARQQWEMYFNLQEQLNHLGLPTEVWLYLKVGGQVVKKHFYNIQQIPKKISA